MDELEALNQLIETLRADRPVSPAEMLHPRIKKARIEATLSKLKDLYEPNQQHPRAGPLTRDGK